MNPKIGPIIISSLILGLVCNWFFVGRLPGLSVLLYVLLTLGFTPLLAWQFRAKIHNAFYWLMPLTLIFSSFVFIRANQLLAFINILTCLYLLSLIARLLQRPDRRLRDLTVADYLALPKHLPIRFFQEFIHVISSLTHIRKMHKKSASYIPVIRGVLLSLPILAVFLVLLSSADMVFGRFISSIFSLDVSPETVFRLGLIGLVASVFIGAFAYIFMPVTVDDTPSDVTHRLGATEAAIVLGSVSTLFLAFVLIQLTYLFGGSGRIASTGLTYAEYARKGFFELIAVAAISLVLVGTIKRVTDFRTEAQKRLFTWLSGALISAVLVIMLSAHLRLDLYEGTYGFTTLRLLSHLFIVWLAYAFTQLFYHIWRNKSDSSYAFQLLMSLLCFIMLINLINPDNFIARRNIARFDRTGKIDTFYLSSLSEDAVPATARLLDHPNPDLQMRAAHILYQKRRSTKGQRQDWLSANIARLRAQAVYDDKAAELEIGSKYMGNGEAMIK